MEPDPRARGSAGLRPGGSARGGPRAGGRAGELHERRAGPFGRRSSRARPGRPSSRPPWWSTSSTATCRRRSRRGPARWGRGWWRVWRSWCARAPAASRSGPASRRRSRRCGGPPLDATPRKVAPGPKHSSSSADTAYMAVSRPVLLALLGLVLATATLFAARGANQSAADPVANAVPAPAPTPVTPGPAKQAKDPDAKTLPRDRPAADRPRADKPAAGQARRSGPHGLHAPARRRARRRGPCSSRPQGRGPVLPSGRRRRCGDRRRRGVAARPQARGRVPRRHPEPGQAIAASSADWAWPRLPPSSSWGQGPRGADRGVRRSGTLRQQVGTPDDRARTGRLPPPAGSREGRRSAAALARSAPAAGSRRPTRRTGPSRFIADVIVELGYVDREQRRRRRAGVPPRGQAHRPGAPRLGRALPRAARPRAGRALRARLRGPVASSSPTSRAVNLISPQAARGSTRCRSASTSPAP